MPYPIIKFPEIIYNKELTIANILTTVPEPPKPILKFYLGEIVAVTIMLAIVVIFFTQESFLKEVLFLGLGIIGLGLVFSFFQYLYYLFLLLKYHFKYCKFLQNIKTDIYDQLNKINIFDEIEKQKYKVYNHEYENFKEDYTTKPGRWENQFYQYLRKQEPNSFYKNMIISYEGDYPYQPDIIYKHSIFDICIDIEIDEPFYKDESGFHKAIHYADYQGIHKDCDRDNYFLERGWIVIRFTEKQIVTEPENCYKLILEVIKHWMHKQTIDIPNIVLKSNIDIEEFWTTTKYPKREYSENNLVKLLK